MKLQAAIDKAKEKNKSFKSIQALVDWIYFNALDFFPSEQINDELKELAAEEDLHRRKYRHLQPYHST